MGLVAALRFPDGQVISQGARAQALVGCYDMNAQRQPPEHTALPASLPCINDGVQVDRSRKEYQRRLVGCSTSDSLVHQDSAPHFV